MTSKETILVVDDEEVNLIHFQMLVEDEYEVLIADSGISGLAILNEHPNIRAIVVDMKMVEMNGMEFIHKASQLHPNKVFLMLTGYSMTEEIAAGIRSGLVYEYIQKPLDKDIIVYKLKEALASTNPHL